MNISAIANHLTLQNLMNCYVKETGKGEWKPVSEVSFSVPDEDIKQVLMLTFPKQSTTVYVPVRYQSVTDRHLFTEDMFYQIAGGEWLPLDFMTMITFIQKDLSEDPRQIADMDELLLRTILSFQNMKSIIANRSSSLEECYQTEKTFLQSEQSLLIGHQVHPTPKSRQGIDEDEEYMFAPEQKGSFSLHYFQASPELVDEDSALNVSVSKLIKNELLNDPSVSDSFKESYCQDDSRSLIPVHPLQARKLLGREDVCQLIQSGKLAYLGPVGRVYYPTSSVRTVYHPESPFMFKFSIPVKITNSLRINKRKELDRGVEVTRLLQSGIAEQMGVDCPEFKIIEDPAYINLKLEGEESGFEVVIRENCFQGKKAERTTLLAALCQDHITGEGSHLANIIGSIAQEESISVSEASEKWFKKYLTISLRPLYHLYRVFGIALEAHQQNSVVQLNEDGFPETFYYRDNQGYYFMASKAETLKQMVPDLNDKSDTVCSDEIAEERFRYYVIFNHLFGLVNAFGVNFLADEEELLQMMREELLQLQTQLGDHTNLLDSLLHDSQLPCKANLLTRVKDMDELVGSLAEQSVYVKVKNPLIMNVGESVEV